MVLTMVRTLLGAEPHLGRRRPHPGLAAGPRIGGLPEAQAAVELRVGRRPRRLRPAGLVQRVGSDMENYAGAAIGSLMIGGIAPAGGLRRDALGIRARSRRSRCRYEHRATLPRTARPRTRPRPGRLRAGELTGLGFVAPFLVFYALFLILPLVLGVDHEPVQHQPCASRPRAVRRALATTASCSVTAASGRRCGTRSLFTLVSTPCWSCCRCSSRSQSTGPRRGQWFFRLAFFLPYILPSAVIALIWTWLYEPGYGLIDGALHFFGLGAPGWLSSTSPALYSIVIVTVWWTIGFNFILFLAGLQEIPRDLYEAASIDGASWWTQVRRITLPMLGRTITLVAVLQVIASLKIFDQVYLITRAARTTRPAPRSSTSTTPASPASGSATPRRRHSCCSW